MSFKLKSPYKPSGDQPQAIDQLASHLNSGVDSVTLLGVTGSGKTFTMANVIEKLDRPALILSHNKTLAAQLYGEFKAFFPENAVEYFVSYYDYYQPEAYMVTTDTYIEKDLSINQEIEKLRISATTALLSGRRDVIVVSSVSCLYGIGNPDDFHSNTIELEVGKTFSRNSLLYALVDSMYIRNEAEFTRGVFRVKGDTVDIYPAYMDMAVRVIYFGDDIESIESFDPMTSKIINQVDRISIYPANIFVTTKERGNSAIEMIKRDLESQCDFFDQSGKSLESKRLRQRVEFDIEMIKEIGYCSGIENYSRYFDGRDPGTRPFCLLDYFPKDFITFVDESHVTLPQIRGMFGGDKSRKEVLINYGFRLPAAADNRPLRFDEFEAITGQKVFVSATPADYELSASNGLIVEQVVRPTGLLDPPIEIRPIKNQIDDILEEISARAKSDERILVTTLTKRMSEELDKFFEKIGVRSRYMHSDIDTLERIEILEDFQAGRFDVLIGVNLLREGLDLPQVSLVAILDADKEGFLRSETSLTQTAGRAARNVEGKVIFYADKITDSMRKTMNETERRREKQIKYNLENGIVPTQIEKQVRNVLGKNKEYYTDPIDRNPLLNDPIVSKFNKEQLKKAITESKRKMEESAKILDFQSAIRYRDEMNELIKLYES